MAQYPDFFEYITEYHSGLLKFLDKFEEIGYKETRESIEEHPEIQEFLEDRLSKYNRLTSEAYFENTTRPYDYEDKNGFRYDASGNVVRYPKNTYEEAREEYKRIKQGLEKYLN